MKVISQNPIYVDTRYSNLDASSSPTDIKKFQNWLESKKAQYIANIKYKYGLWDEPTKAAWNKFGAEFEQSTATKDNTKREVKKIEGKVDQVERELEKEKSKAEKGWKGMPTGVKVAIIGGGALFVIAILAVALGGKK